MFKRSRDEERTELDAAWDDENAAAGLRGSDYVEESDASEAPFPKPHDFNLTSDSVPANASERDEATGVPFDADDSFAYDAESEEFTSGDASGFLDDSHTDFYSYGQKKHGVHDAPENADAAGSETSAAVVGGQGRHGSGRSSKRSKYDEMPEHQKRSRRVRRVLIVVVLLLIALLGALGYFGWRLFQEGREVAVQETTDLVNEVEEAAVTEEVSFDATTANVKKTDVPMLMDLLGLTTDEAVKKVGHGATVTLDSEVADAESPMSHRLTVVLTEEPADAKSGAPTVYLGLDGDGKVVTAGYSAAMASLGYGSLSFVDAVSHEHVVEKTLAEAGLNVKEGTVELPESSTYSTYAADKTTLVKEQCAFDGEAAQGGTDYLWTSVLVYNYTAANATGNLADTVRQIYVYVSEKEASEAAIAAKAQAGSESTEQQESESSSSQPQSSSQDAQEQPSDQPAEGQNQPQR